MQKALSVIFGLAAMFSLPVVAYAIDSSNYGIPQYQLPQGGAEVSSDNYGVRGTLAPQGGVASSSNYELDTGFPSVTGVVISLTLDSTAVNLGSLNPGSPVTGTTTTTIATDSSAGYNLAIQKDKLMTHTDAVTTIPDWTGTIATPTTYTGTGLGFTVSSGSSVEAKWGSGTKYAAIPTQTKTTYHQLISSISTPNNTTIEYKLDVDGVQKAGTYSTNVAIFATPLP